ncbi:RNA polymerase sigma factor [Thalassotalea sp. LPB0316]|uniref:RNA polymerase sigma factor n=1 Tax=Thalassotalea sp. LPB0316 TaxID=2769490 RepID=UPI001865EBEF|nr:RNA polymerase sigma factor [Thalassotalea sp. LPB0316]QOL26434.1 RNA polymerase sigma factor [Thalassotalea sp. LPB0316]
MKLPSKVKGWLNIQSHPEALLKAYHLHRDTEALTRLVSLYQTDIYHYLVSLSDKDIAQDAIQSTWLKVINSTPLNDYQHIKAWLFRIARNTLFDEFNKRNKFVSDEHAAVELTTQPLSEQIDKEDKLNVLNQALAQLNFFQREAIIFQQEGFSVEQIAELTNESFETVKSRIRYGKAKLKQLIEENS